MVHTCTVQIGVNGNIPCGGGTYVRQNNGTFLPLVQWYTSAGVTTSSYYSLYNTLTVNTCSARAPAENVSFSQMIPWITTATQCIHKEQYSHYHTSVITYRLIVTYDTPTGLHMYRNTEFLSIAVHNDETWTTYMYMTFYKEIRSSTYTYLYVFFTLPVIRVNVVLQCCFCIAGQSR